MLLTENKEQTETDRTAGCARARKADSVLEGD